MLLIFNTLTLFLSFNEALIFRVSLLITYGEQTPAWSLPTELVPIL